MILFKFITFMLCVAIHQCRLPDKVFCVNEECSEPISKAKTLIKYNSGDTDVMSFASGRDAMVFMKSAGENTDLWYALIDGKQGFVPSKFLREHKIFEKDPKVVKPLEVKNKQAEVQPDKVQQAHEVFEGTTIYNPDASPSTPVEETTVETSVPMPTEDTPSVIPVTETPELTENTQVNIVENVDDNKSSESGIPSETNQEESQVPPELNVEPNSNTVSSDIPKTQSFESTSESSTQEKPKVLESISPPIADQPEILPQAQPLISSSSGENLSQETIVNLPESLLQEPPLHAVPLESEQNTSSPSLSNTLNNPETAAITKSETNQVPDQSIPSTPGQIEQDITNVPHSQPTENPSENMDTKTTVNGDEIQNQFIPVTTETIPAIFPSDNFASTTEQAVTYSATSEEASTTIEMDPTTSTPEELTSQETQPPTQQSSTENIYTDTLSTENIEYTPSVENVDAYTSTETTTEVPLTLETTESSVLEETETVPVSEENKGGVLSSMFSTLSDMWPSTTQAPPTESIYNTEQKDTEPQQSVEDLLETIKEPENPDHIYHSDATREPEQTDLNEEQFSFVNYFTDLYISVFGSKYETRELFASPGEKCFSNEFQEDSPKDTSRLLTFLVTTAAALLLFTLGYYYIDVKRQDGKSVAMVNSLQRDLLCTTKECEILKEELTTTKTKLTGIEDSSFGKDDMVQSLKEEIQELKAQNDRLRNSLDDNEKLLRVSENTAGELQNTLSEVENTLSELLSERAQSEEHIAELNAKMQAFEEELIAVTRDRDAYQLKYVSAEVSLEDGSKMKKEIEELVQKLEEASSTISLQKHEIGALKEAMKELKSSDSNVDVSSVIDHSEIKAKLSKALEEKNSLDAMYKNENKERLRLEETLKTTQESLKSSSQQAKECSTRLEVLEKYFQEREGELLKELNAKEALWLSKKGESASTVEKIELLQQEVQRYKEKCDTLSLELAELESSKRTTIAEWEARAHDAWLDARAARRDAVADREDAALLRRKLALITTAEGTTSPSHRISSPLEGVVPEGALPFLPPPLPFLPPLPPPLPRPPPLGRLPSPHPPRYSDRRYSPDSRYSPSSRYSPDTARYSPDTARYSPDSRYSPDRRRAYPTRRAAEYDRDRYKEVRQSRQRNGLETETEYASDSPSHSPRRRRKYSRSGSSTGSGCSSESDK